MFMIFIRYFDLQLVTAFKSEEQNELVAESDDEVYI